MKPINEKLILLVILGQTLLCIFITSIALGSVNNLYLNLIPVKTLVAISVVGSVIFFVLGFYLVFTIIRVARKEREAEIMAIKLEDNMDLIKLLRIQRHDFLNHLQVIYGLVQLKKYDNLKDYIKRVSGEIQKYSAISRIEKPEIAALFLKKDSEARERAVNVEYEIDTNFQDLSIPSCDLTSIIGNLINNALEALNIVHDSERRLYIACFETDDKYIIEVKNNLPIIPHEVQKKIFEKGFSSENSDGCSSGLYLVKRLVHQYCGTISLVSEEGEGTRFTVKLPKKCKKLVFNN